MTRGTADVALIVELGAGNPGAITVCSRLSAGGRPDVLEALDALGLRGERVWVHFKDRCGGDLQLFADSVCSTAAILKAKRDA